VVIAALRLNIIENTFGEIVSQLVIKGVVKHDLAKEYYDTINL
jgi:hypothetical protein